MDILVNNAGGAPQSENYHVWDRKLEDWKYVIDTNLTGTFLCTQAAELGPYGIRVNAISPGGVYRNHDPEFVRRYSNATVLGRMAREGFDMKGTAILLASDAGAYITGENILVDGGFTIFK